MIVILEGGQKGKRGRGAGGKIPVFGILKRGGLVYTQVIDDAKTTPNFNANYS